MKKVGRILGTVIVLIIASCMLFGCTVEKIYNGPKPVVTMTVKDMGVIKIELYPDMAPNTVANFISLANKGFYDGLIFHRVISGFMIQGGDPAGNGTGGPGYEIPGEFPDNGFKQNTLKHTRGVISMARRGSYPGSAADAALHNTAGSQFFIMHTDYPSLDGEYAPFGMVIEGIEIVDKIAAVETDENDKPLSDVVIESVTVDTFGVKFNEPKKS